MKGNTRKRGGQIGNKNAEVWTEEKLIEVGNELIEWMKVKNNLFYEEFLLEKGLYTSFLARYVDQFNSFAKLVEQASKLQEFKLKKGGLLKDFDGSITKFCLINHHGFVSEKTQTEQTGTQKIEFVDTVVTKKI